VINHETYSEELKKFEDMKSTGTIFVVLGIVLPVMMPVFFITGIVLIVLSSKKLKELERWK
jgi:hypothetical protein